MLHFLDNKKAGIVPPGSRTSMESDSFMAAMPLAALQGCSDEQPGEDDALARVIFLVNAHEQNASQLIFPALRLLRQVIRTGHSIDECLSQFTSNGDCPPPFCHAVSTARENVQRPLAEVSDEVGSACSNPASLICALHAVLSLPVYTDAVRAIALAGGCSCSRCVAKKNKPVTSSAVLAQLFAAVPS